MHIFPKQPWPCNWMSPLTCHCPIHAYISHTAMALQLNVSSYLPLSHTCIYFPNSHGLITECLLLFATVPYIHIFPKQPWPYNWMSPLICHCPIHSYISQTTMALQLNVSSYLPPSHTFIHFTNSHGLTTECLLLFATVPYIHKFPNPFCYLVHKQNTSPESPFQHWQSMTNSSPFQLSYHVTQVII
jgi:hypothetical protein